MVGLGNRKGRIVKRYEEIGALLSTRAARRALNRRDVVQVYRLLIEGGLSRELIAELTGQHVSEVAEILAGSQVNDYDMLVRIAAGLGLHRAAIGLSFGDDALDYGSNAAAPPDPVTEDWGDTPLPFWIEETDVAGLEVTTARLRDLDLRYGSHWAFLKVVAAHAQYSERLLSSAYTGKTRRRLALAVCDAYSLAGWVALDVSRRKPAWDHFQRSLLFGWAAQDEVAVMGAIQSVGRLDLHEAPDFALKIFQLAQLNGSSAIIQAFLKADEGWAAALLGQTEDARYAIQRAKAMFEDADPDSARPSWMDPAQALPDLLSVTGAAQLQLGNLSEAVADLSYALGARPAVATRSHATDGAALATAYLRAGEVELGLSTGHRAVDAARQMPSARVRGGLARLHLELVGRSDIPSRELAERVAGLPTWKMARRLGLSRDMLQSYAKYGQIEPDLVMPGGHYRFDPQHARQQLQQLRCPRLGRPST
jgi:transcriptional regulator with XRE-family HTH domain